MKLVKLIATLILALGLVLLLVAGKIIEENHHAKLYAKQRG